MNHLALAKAKKMLDKNSLKNAQMTTDCLAPDFQVGDRVCCKNRQTGKWNLKCRATYGIVCIEHNGHYLHIKNETTGKNQSCNIKDVVHERPVKLWNIDTQFGRAGKLISPLANLPTITLHDT